MKCEICGQPTKIFDSRPSKIGVWRRHECPQGHRSSTYEITADLLFRLGKAAFQRDVLSAKERAVLGNMLERHEDQHGPLRLVK